MTGSGVLPAQRFGINLCYRDAGQYYWLAIREFSDQGQARCAQKRERPLLLAWYRQTRRHSYSLFCSSESCYFLLRLSLLLAFLPNLSELGGR